MQLTLLKRLVEVSLIRLTKSQLEESLSRYDGYGSAENFIIPSCSHSILLTKYAEYGLVGATMK